MYELRVGKLHEPEPAEPWSFEDTVQCSGLAGPGRALLLRHPAHVFHKPLPVLVCGRSGRPAPSIAPLVLWSRPPNARLPGLGHLRHLFWDGRGRARALGEDRRTIQKRRDLRFESSVQNYRCLGDGDPLLRRHEDEEASEGGEGETADEPIHDLVADAAASNNGREAGHAQRRDIQAPWSGVEKNDRFPEAAFQG